MPRISVFTPSHRPGYLDHTCASMLAQTFTDWEWVVLLNGGARWEPASPDPRIRVIVDDTVAGVGAAKRQACALTTAELLLELDHDDLLASTALAEVVQAFDALPHIGFVYSHLAQILEDGSPDEGYWREDMGWQQRRVDIDGQAHLQITALAPTPHNVSLIWWAPNHLRAFRRSTYHAAGGYDAGRTVLDDQDLMCRLYELTDFHLIDSCLYLQRMHPANTQRDPDINAQIQRETLEVYDSYVERCALAWARRRGLLALDIGSGDVATPGFLGLDRRDLPGVEIVRDLTQGLPLDDASVGVVRAVDILQLLPDKVAILNELHRVLAHGGLLLSSTPSTDGRGAFQDPSHVSYWNENSFWYATDSRYTSFVEGVSCRFQVSRLRTWFPSPWHAEHQISYVAANLIALHGDGPRQGGTLSI